MNLYLFTGIMLLGLTSVCAYATTFTRFSAQADVYSEPLSIDAFTDDWEAPSLQKGNAAFAQGRIELMQQVDKMQYSMFWSYDYLLKFSPDTARLYYQIQNDLPLEQNHHYNLFINAQHIETLGWRIGRIWQPTDQMQVTTGFSLLQGRHFLQGKFSGNGYTLNNQPNMLDGVDRIRASLNYYYDKPALHEEELGWAPGIPQGYGAALDLALKATLTDTLTLDTSIHNLLGYMWWDNAPNTAYTLDYELNRLPHADIKGQLNHDTTFQQHLPYRLDANMTYQPKDQPWSSSISLLHNKTGILAQLNAYYELAGQTVGIHAEPQSHAFGLSVKNRYFGLRYLSDSLNTNQAQRYSLYLYGLYQW